MKQKKKIKKLKKELKVMKVLVKELMDKKLEKANTEYKLEINDVKTNLGTAALPLSKKDSEQTKTIRPPIVSKYPTETKLLAFTCEECGISTVIKVPRDTGTGDSINCRCGHEIQIKNTKRATGDCANCETKFYNMTLINGTRELICRNCKSPIDLVETDDGSLTGSHNIKY